MLESECKTFVMDNCLLNQLLTEKVERKVDVCMKVEKASCMNGLILYKNVTILYVLTNKEVFINFVICQFIMGVWGNLGTRILSIYKLLCDEV